MADSPTIDNGDLTDFVALTDDCGAAGHAQGVKIAYSADGVATFVTVDASGVLCNLGANNDVTVTSGTVTIGAALPAGTAEIGKLAAGTANIGDVDVLTLPALPTGTNTIGLVKLTDGTTMPTVVDTGGTHDGLGVAILGADGEQVNMARPLLISVTPSLSITPAYSAGDIMDTDDLEFAAAASTAAGSGHLLRVTFIDRDDLTHDVTNGAYYLHLFSAAVTMGTENAAYALTNDTMLATYVGTVDSDDGVWYDHGPGSTCTVQVSPPLAYDCAVTTLYGALVAKTLASAEASAGGMDVNLLVLPD